MEKVITVLEIKLVGKTVSWLQKVSIIEDQKTILQSTERKSGIIGQVFEEDTPELVIQFCALVSPLEWEIPPENPLI